MDEKKEEKIKEITRKAVSGEIKLYALEQTLPADDAVSVRRCVIEKKAKTKLDNLSHYSFDVETASKKNIENMIGAIQIPLGVAGPAKIKGQYAKGEFYVPLATTEGALVASVNRGLSVISKSGGAVAFVENKGMTRAPVFRTKGLKESMELVSWVEKNFKRIKEVAESTTRFGKLMSIKPWVVGRNVHLRFVFDTKDAMGMNMAVMACDKVVTELIEKETKVKCISLTGNMCVDKKPSALNFIEGRGKAVHAEVILKKEFVIKTLKTTPKDLVEINYRKNLLGSAMAQSLGFNAQFANITAAIFAATGQDLAHVAEASMGVTTAEMHGEDLYISCYLPNLNVGTVGGGTGLVGQREALSIMGVTGDADKSENTMKFAEIIAVAVLAGEISLLSAHVAGHLAKAHATHGRGKGK
ncbi:MAG: hydroxymethylglutaryl-CoA reductase (NADPH) [Candidatus Aenigmarchaeota archaeon]|nr:hydroxymethylglutaryl-CoA reductase (NADPH) [Candidatus Aenigmarchaeota archaeon]